MEKVQAISRLEQIKKRSLEFNPAVEAIGLLREAERDGSCIKKFDTKEQAEEVLMYTDALVGFLFEEKRNFGVVLVRDQEVNIFSYWNPISEEEERQILERRKREWQSKFSKKEPAWLKKHRERQQQNPGSRYRR